MGAWEGVVGQAWLYPPLDMTAPPEGAPAAAGGGGGRAARELVLDIPRAKQGEYKRLPIAVYNAIVTDTFPDVVLAGTPVDPLFTDAFLSLLRNNLPPPPGVEKPNKKRARDNDAPLGWTDGELQDLARMAPHPITVATTAGGVGGGRARGAVVKQFPGHAV